MTTYIVEVPDGGDYRKVEVQADSAWNDSYGLTFEREKKAVAMFRDWICFYRKETGDSPTSAVRDDVADAFNDAFNRYIDRRGGFER